MSPTIPHKYKYFHCTVQRAKDRRPKFHFCRLPFDVRPRNVKLNLSSLDLFPVAPSSIPRTRCVNNQLVSLPPAGILRILLDNLEGS